MFEYLLHQQVKSIGEKESKVFPRENLFQRFRAELYFFHVRFASEFATNFKHSEHRSGLSENFGSFFKCLRKRDLKLAGMLEVSNFLRFLLSVGSCLPCFAFFFGGSFWCEVPGRSASRSFLFLFFFRPRSPLTPSSPLSSRTLFLPQRRGSRRQRVGGRPRVRAFFWSRFPARAVVAGGAASRQP